MMQSMKDWSCPAPGTRRVAVSNHANFDRVVYPSLPHSDLPMKIERDYTETITRGHSEAVLVAAC